MFRVPRIAAALLALGLVSVVTSSVRATVPDAAEHSTQRFLAQDDTVRPYRAARRLEVENGSRKGWLEAITEYSPKTGFRYEITVEGGSGYLRSKVLRGLLDAEQEVIARGETTRSSLATSNYTFRANGASATTVSPTSSSLQNVYIVRRYERIAGNVVPVSLETTAQLRFLGEATLRMTYAYSEIDGHPIPTIR